MANITKGLAHSIAHRPLWKQQDKRGAELCDCCKYKNRKKIDYTALQRKNIVALGLAHYQEPLEYFSGCIIPKMAILKCPPKNGCDAWQPLWEKQRQILEVMREIERAMKPRKRAKIAGQRELWERE